MLTVDPTLGPDEDSIQAARKVGLLPLLRGLPPQIGLQPSSATTPPLLGPQGQTQPQSQPVARAPLQPQPTPAQDRYGALSQQGPPQLHGVRKFLDVLGQGLAPTIESAIPGTPGYYARQLNQARQGAEQESVGQERQANEAYQQYEMNKPEVVAPGSYVGRPETGFQEVGTPKEPKADEKPFDVWRQQNPNAPVEDWLKLQGQQAKQVNDAYHYWLASHPGGTYDAFLKDVQQYKGQTRLSGMGAYTLTRLIDSAAKYDPRLEPLIPALAAELGVNLPAGFSLNGPAPGQPRNDQGQPIGLAQPEAPTSATRGRGQFAQSSVTTQVPGLKKEINSLRNELGPVQGRWNEFLTGSVGADNPKLYGLRTGLQNLSTAWMRLHANSDAARQEFEQALGRSRTPDDLIAALDSIDRQAQSYVRQGKGQPNTAPEGQSPTEKPVYKNGKLIGYTVDGNTLSRVAQ